MNSDWPEPIVRVQSLSESGLTSIPTRYIKPLEHRNTHQNNPVLDNIPVIDLKNLSHSNSVLRDQTMQLISSACREWGFFQAVNHGVDVELMSEARERWRDFFHLPMDVKQKYANAPTTYEGYGSRLGVEKKAILDWSDYFFLNYLPIRNSSKWPSNPPSSRKTIEEYSEEIIKLCGKLLKVFSIDLGLEEEYLERAFGGENKAGACLRANLYPKCPQPDLTLGLSSHSDPGGMTVLLPDNDVAGLQVRKDGHWITVKPVPNALIINIGDQIQVMSNAIYKSIEHRVIVNPDKERVSLAFFYNPKSDILIQPAAELVTEDRPALYKPTTFDDYRLYIRKRGPCGKSQVESLNTSN